MGCGYGPYDYGNCGCPIGLDGLFDVYLKPPDTGSVDPPAAPFTSMVRMGLVVPKTVDKPSTAFLAGDPTANYNSWYCDADGNWNVTLSAGASSGFASLVGGYPSGSEKVWISNGNDDTNQKLSLIDAVAKTELLYVTETDDGLPSYANIQHQTIGAIGGVTNVCGANQSEIAFYADRSTDVSLIGKLCIVKSDGTIDEYLDSYPSGVLHSAITPPSGYDSFTPLVFPPRSWPTVCGYLAPTGGGSAIVVFGDASGAALSGSFTTIYTGTTVKSFDVGPDGWICAKASAGGVDLLINGTTVLTAPSYGEWNVHAAQPHETLGGGYFVVCRPIEPFPGIGFDWAWKVSVFNGTTLIWDADYVGALTFGTITCQWSSDRWLYFRNGSGNDVANNGGTADDEDPAGVTFPPNETIPSVGDHHSWCVKHDGSQSFAGGRMIRVSSVLTITEYPGSNSARVDGRRDVVHSSDVVQYSLPADANDFVDFEVDP